MLDPIQLTKELVAINSVNPFTTINYKGREYGIGNEAEINDFLEDKLRSLGFQVSKQIYQEEFEIKNSDGTTGVVPKRWNVIAEKGSGKRSILFFGHTDTVEVKNGWQCDPFSGEERVINNERRFYALGANDMKAGLAVILSACENLAPKDFKIKIAFCSDEEFWSYGAHALCQSDFLEDVSLVLVPEMLENAHENSDTAWLGLGRLGRVEFVVDVRGVSCHGADAFSSKKAVNAVHESAKIQVELLGLFETVKASYRSEDYEVYNSAFISYQKGGAGTLSVPDSASFIVDRCLIPGETAEEELHRIQSFLNLKREEGAFHKDLLVRVRLRPRPTPPCQPYVMPSQSTLSKFIINETRKVEKVVVPIIGRSVADENRIAQLGIPTYIIPPRGADSHTSSEWVELGSILRMRDILKKVCLSTELSELLSGE